MNRSTTTAGHGARRRSGALIALPALAALTLLAACRPSTADPTADENAAAATAAMLAQADAPTAAPPTAAPSSTPVAPAATATATCPRGEVESIPVEGAVTGLSDALRHGDLNPSLRGAEPMDVAHEYVHYDGGADPNAPQLAALLGRKPDITGAWDVYEWDWTQDPPRRHEQLFRTVHNVPWPALTGLAVEPGEAVRVPGRGPDIYQGRFVALLVSASEHDVQWVYTRQDEVGSGYAIWVDGLRVDCNLLDLYRAGRESGEGLPGLAADQIVGVAAGDTIRVAIRDRGSFMDTRSTKDWWR